MSPRFPRSTSLGSWYPTAVGVVGAGLFAACAPVRPATPYLVADPPAIDLSTAQASPQGLVAGTTIANRGGAGTVTSVHLDGGAGEVALVGPGAPFPLAPDATEPIAMRVVDLATLPDAAPDATLVVVSNTGSLEIPIHFGHVAACDADADGAYAAACGGPDCDDTNAAVHPGAVEQCDGLDDDCDGVVDNAANAILYHADADGDGFGDPSTARWSCTPIDGYVLDGTDCDDTNPRVHPGAPEYCDGLDDNCNGVVDENAVDMSTWYRDSDGDGLGDPYHSVHACAAPAGYVANFDDCDDTTAAVGADGCRPACFVPPPGHFRGSTGDVTQADATIVGEGNLFGTHVAVTDVNGDGCADLIVTTGSNIPFQESTVGTIYVFYGPVIGQVPLRRADAVILGGSFVLDARPELTAVNANNDAYGDLAFATHGLVYLFDGPIAGRLGLAQASASVAIDSTPLGAVGGSADLTGDGRPDLLVEAADQTDPHDFAPPQVGVAVIPGPFAGAESFSGSDLTQIDGEHGVGHIAVVGDLDGNHATDLIVVGDFGPSQFAAYGVTGFFFGPLDGRLVMPDDATYTQQWLSPTTTVAALGDVDGDGVPDYVIGDEEGPPTAPQQGIVQLFLGSASAPTPIATWTGTQVNELLGDLVVAAGDVDGDGRPDFLFTEGRALALVRGRPRGQTYPARPDWRREMGPTYHGTLLQGASGDLNGDGYSDIVVSAPYGNDGSTENVGVVYVFYGLPH